MSDKGIKRLATELDSASDDVAATAAAAASMHREEDDANEAGNENGDEDEVSSDDPDDEPAVAGSRELPRKRFYRQRAHINPIADHYFEYPVTPGAMDWTALYPEIGNNQVEFADIGCGFGGLLLQLGKSFPDTFSLGMEIRLKVSEYVKDKIIALRERHPGKYQNVAVIRGNAMKYFPCFFRKGQLKKIFFLFPDPHFKKQKHKWRIVSPTLLAEYAYALRPGGIVYTVTDVHDLHMWMKKHLEEHPLFRPLTAEELATDPVIPKLFESSEEGKKVTRNSGQKYLAVFMRLEG